MCYTVVFNCGLYLIFQERRKKLQNYSFHLQKVVNGLKEEGVSLLKNRISVFGNSIKHPNDLLFKVKYLNLYLIIKMLLFYHQMLDYIFIYYFVKYVEIYLPHLFLRNFLKYLPSCYIMFNIRWLAAQKVHRKIIYNLYEIDFPDKNPLHFRGVLSNV